MSKPQTRAQALGVKSGVLARKTQTLLKTAAVALSKASDLWSEVDGGMETDFEDLANKVVEIANEDGALAEAVERLGEPWGDEP